MWVKTLVLVALATGSLGFPGNKFSVTDGAAAAEGDARFLDLGEILGGMIRGLLKSENAGETRSLEEKLKLQLGPVAVGLLKGTRAEKQERILGIITGLFGRFIRESNDEERINLHFGPIGIHIIDAPAGWQEKILGLISGLLKLFMRSRNDGELRSFNEEKFLPIGIKLLKGTRAEKHERILGLLTGLLSGLGKSGGNEEVRYLDEERLKLHFGNIGIHILDAPPQWQEKILNFLMGLLGLLKPDNAEETRSLDAEKLKLQLGSIGIELMKAPRAEKEERIFGLLTSLFHKLLKSVQGEKLLEK